MSRWLGERLASADAPAWRGVALTALLLVAVGLVFYLGGRILGPDAPAAARRWLSLARGPWALPGSVAAFVVLAFLGVPQLLLIAAAVVVFGPTSGAVFSWVGTFVSALIGFAAGRLLRPRMAGVARGDRLRRYAELVARNGFWATIAVRLAPIAPFILVNLAAGASGIALADYAGGTALGIIPKIAITAFAGQSSLRLMRGGSLAPVILLAGAAALWLASTLLARRLLRRPPP